MTKLYIDTSSNKKTIVGLDDNKLEKEVGVGKSQQVLTMIDEILKKNKGSLKGITQIQVETGPGSFTGLRVGICVANALGWVLKVPVNGLRANEKSVVEPVYE